MLEQQALDCAFVRIWGSDETVAGAGFLIQSQYVLTCAHVVNHALDLPDEGVQKPGAEATVFLDFPILLASPVVRSQRLSSRVVVWSPVDREKAFQDIAILKILDPCPATASAIPLKDHDPSSKVMVKGFPLNFDDAAIAPCASVIGAIARGLIQLHDEAKTGILIQPGFSGAPVWDVQQQAAVGMLVISAPDQSVAQMISVNCLQYVFLALVLYEFGASDDRSFTVVERAYRYAVPASWARKDLPHLFEELLLELSDIPPDASVTALSRFSAYLLACHKLNPETTQRFSEWCDREFSDFETLIKEAKRFITQHDNQARERSEGTIQPHVLISVQPTQGKYHVMAWQVPDWASYVKDKVAGIELWRQTEQPIDRKAISEQVCQWVQNDRAHLNNSIMEFFLPLDCMDEAVDSWEIEDEHGISIPLGAEYVALVRCFDRTLESYSNRNGWVLHWKNKETQARRNSVDVLVEGCLELQSLFSKLNQSPETIGFHLAKPPDKFGKGSIFAVMLRTAHPVAIWLRESVSGVNCEQALEAFLQSHPIDVLPTAVKQERSNALAVGRDCHIGHHLSLLWENPHLLPPIVDEGAMFSNLGL
jgi:vWA-MoxR associated protein C-terminal domain/vWA-MoxR associated protein middle region (VMAP-M) 1/Trypsin-like peptidase domain